MSDEVCLLVTVLYNGGLLRCAVKASRDLLPGDCVEYPMESENLAVIRTLLPLHVRSCGPIVEVQRIFEVHLALWKEQA